MNDCWLPDQLRNFRAELVRNPALSAEAERANIGAQVIPNQCGEEGKGESAATKLIRLAEGMELFHDPAGEAYATAKVADHCETMRVNSRAFRRWLALQFYVSEGKAPAVQSMTAALATIEAESVFEGAEHQVHVRVAEHDGSIFLDLCRPDWKVVRITIDAWTIVETAPVKFVRREGMLSLPTPLLGGSFGLLRSLVNVRGEDWPLVAGYMLGCMREKGPFPVLALVGEQGSGKTTFTRMLKNTLDPTKASARAAPKDERDLLIAAEGCHIVALDNLSHLDEHLSDALCRLATGAGLSRRKLYTDDDEKIFEASRPVIVNAIGDIISRPDLLDRAILVETQIFEESQQRTEEEVWDEFHKVHPLVLGTLCTAASHALRGGEKLGCISRVRMLDFCRFVTHGEKGLGLPPKAFSSAYANNRKTANETAVELSPVARAVQNLLEARTEWRGSFTELLAMLSGKIMPEILHSREWPKTQRGLSSALRRVAPSLRQVGIKVDFPGRDPESRRKLVEIQKAQKDVSDVSNVPEVTASTEGSTGEVIERKEDTEVGVGVRNIRNIRNKDSNSCHEDDEEWEF